MQEYIRNDIILSGRDRSDGGLLTTLCEMSLSSNIGINIEIPYNIPNDEYIHFV